MRRADLFGGASAGARDAALEVVAENAEDATQFMSRGLRAIAALSGEYTGEDVRRCLTAAGVTPHHHNAWGALIRSAIKSGLLVPTGRYVRMTAVRSHARATQVLRAGRQEA